jgi:AraC-like DNA-binding protein
MAITLTFQEELELWQEASEYSSHNSSTQTSEFFTEMPGRLGRGCNREIELHPHLWLKIFDQEYCDDFLFKYPTSSHPLQFTVFLSGVIKNDCGYVGKASTVISGGGIQRAMKTGYFQNSRIMGIDIQMPPELLATFFPGKDGGIPAELKFLAKGNDFQSLIYQKITPEIRLLAEQIYNCPYQGMKKRIYLQGKVLELIALQLTPMLEDEATQQAPPRLKSKTIAQIYYAKDILLSHLENPPSLLELAAQVGISDRTLRRGFRELFGTGVLGYLTDRRMELAEKLLRQGNITVAEVANSFGYAQQGHFTTAFKRKFGITPSQCLSGKKSSLGQ